MKRKAIIVSMGLLFVCSASTVWAAEREDIRMAQEMRSENQTEETLEIQNLEEQAAEEQEISEKAVEKLSPVTGISAESAGKNKVKLRWKATEGAEGYILYRQVGKGKSSYLYITSNTTFVDTKASGLDYNFYFVYPYYTHNGKRIITTENATYVYAKASLPAAGNLKAVSAGKNKVRLSWEKVSEAEGYIIYRKTGDGVFTHRGMTSNLSYTDTTASGSEYNFYRIYPYYKENGKNVAGSSKKYVYAKAGLPAVKNLRAQNVGKTIKLTWDKLPEAEGYLIYRQEGKGEFQYLYMKDANAPSFVDTKCSGADYNYYRVYPYYKDAEGKMITGRSDTYVWSYIRLDAVKNLWAEQAGYEKIKVSWKKAYGAEGYIILRQIGNGNVEVIGEVEGGNTLQFTDTKASITERNYYGVIPYIMDGKGQVVVADIVAVTQGKCASDIPDNAPRVQIRGLESYTDAYRILDKVNEARKAEGLNEVKMDKDLMEAAMQRAAELVVNMSHIRPYGGSCFTVCDKAMGENIAAGTLGFYDADRIMEAWMNSPGHRANILREEYVSIGVGAFQYNGIEYWVQLFGIGELVPAEHIQDRMVTRIVATSLQKKILTENQNDGVSREVDVDSMEDRLKNFQDAVLHIYK